MTRVILTFGIVIVKATKEQSYGTSLSTSTHNTRYHSFLHYQVAQWESTLTHHLMLSENDAEIIQRCFCVSNWTFF